ncbi:hypothetical protein AKJ44_01525 [candidate division MSBL1 archaeon SCGC-AAA261F17]|uniref:Uncharacterized protein n=1 Tax=candidate division MSBL1 archaeon SCGC-AAA261F17 TaxID=1698274 RepID=A0A133V6J2_9EURY|nr:hypothetical protein AKJ44_01525 [candidate division MSBL1 archaeon SCGC-AAA261F17]
MKGELEAISERLGEIDAELAADLLKVIYDLPETPEAAALLESMSLVRSVGAIRIFVGRDEFGYVVGMFANLTDARMTSTKA